MPAPRRVGIALCGDLDTGTIVTLPAKLHYQCTPEQLDEQLRLRRNRCSRFSRWNMSVSLEEPQFQRDVMEPLFSLGPHGEKFGFVTRLLIQGQGGYSTTYLDDAGLTAVADAILTYLERPQPPVEVKVALEQPKRRRPRKRAAVADDTPLDEKEQIKRNLMGGRR